MTTITDWAALHRDVAETYARHGERKTAQMHRQLAWLIETNRLASLDPPVPAVAGCLRKDQRRDEQEQQTRRPI